MIKHAYVYEKIRNKLAPWIQENEEDGIMPLIIKELVKYGHVVNKIIPKLLLRIETVLNKSFFS